MYFFTKKSSKTFELWNFRILAEMFKTKVRENERKSVQGSNSFVRPTEIFEISRVFLPKEVRNVQGTK